MILGTGVHIGWTLKAGNHGIRRYWSSVSGPGRDAGHAWRVLPDPSTFWILLRRVCRYSRLVVPLAFRFLRCPQNSSGSIPPWNILK